MRSILERLGLKSKRSPLDVSDFFKASLTAPSYADIMAVVNKRFGSEGPMSKPATMLPASATGQRPAQATDPAAESKSDVAAGSSSITTTGDNAVATEEANATGVYGIPSSPEELEIARRRMYFDLKYRCGAQGRCLDGRAPCRFPQCFDCRPIIKGAEVFSERLGFELANAGHPEYRAVIARCADDQLEEGIVEVTELLRTKIAKAEPTVTAFNQYGPAAMWAQQQSQMKGVRKVAQDSSEAFRSDRLDAEEYAEAVKAASPHLHEPITTEDGRVVLPDPGPTPAALRAAKAGPRTVAKASRIDSGPIDEVIATSFWRAALLVNVGRDAEAVADLLVLAATMPREFRAFPLATAAAWAALHDMSVRFFKGHKKEFPEYDTRGRDARAPLLPSVVDAVAKGEEYYLDHVVHAVFSKEVTAILSRAQTAQENGDVTEDPMGSSVVRDSVRFYKNEIGGAFWKQFLNLALMPPLPPPSSREEAAAAAATGFVDDNTPRNVLDAVGRSMLLHHIATSYKDDNAKGDASVMVPEAERCVKRLRDLLAVIKAHEQAGGGGDGLPTRGPGAAPGAAGQVASNAGPESLRISAESPASLTPTQALQQQQELKQQQQQRVALTGAGPGPASAGGPSTPRPYVTAQDRVYREQQLKQQQQKQHAWPSPESGVRK